GPYALSWKPCQGDSLNLPDHSLVLVKSNSYYQAFNVKSLFGEIGCPKKSQVKLKGYDNQVFTSFVFDCDEMFSSESDVSMPASPLYDRYKSRKGYHDVPPPYTGTFMPPKPDLVFHNAPTFNETVPTAFNIEPSTTKPAQDLSQSNRLFAPINEDWVSDSEDDSEAVLTTSRLVPLSATRHVNTVVPHNKVQHQRPPTHGVNKEHSPKRRPINRRPSPLAGNFHQKLLLLKLPRLMMLKVSRETRCGLPTWQLMIGYSYVGRDLGACGGVWECFCTEGCRTHIKHNGGYVTFGGNLKGGKITGKGKIRTDTECIVLSPDFKLADENQVWLRVPRENNMYNVDLKNIVPSGDLTCLFAKATLDESNLWHRRLGHINFKTMNKLVKDPLGKFDRKADEGFLVEYSVSRSGPTWLFNIETLTKSMNYQPILIGNQPNPSANPQNTDDDTTFEVKEPESAVHASPSSRFRNLSKEFEDFSDNSINEVNATSTPVPAVGQISTNSTNTFSATGPSNTTDSPTLGKSLYVDPSQYPDNLNMPALEDITYSDDEEYVSTEADFSNLETNITVSPIPTTRVHKDHHVTQIIGFEDPDYPNKVYKVVKALYGLHQAPRPWYETLANYLLENSFQRGKIDQALFIKKQKGDILLDQVYVDDIIFGSTNKDLCKAFEKLMKDKFQMSSMGELTFSLGLQVKQKQDGIFISQDKYVTEILRKFSLTDGKSASTPIDTEKPLLKDPDGDDVDVHTDRSMIGSLMYLTSSRPDIMFSVCACARFQVTPKALHLHAIKRIFRYLKGKPDLGLWYPKDSSFNLVAYSDSDYPGASLDRKSTTGGCQFLGYRLISWQ
nr:uncharacterized mitochondrial protein AtMg00810-like [Tanacetum cinerariifolium]